MKKHVKMQFIHTGKNSRFTGYKCFMNSLYFCSGVKYNKKTGPTGTRSKCKIKSDIKNTKIF